VTTARTGPDQQGSLARALYPSRAEAELIGSILISPQIAPLVCQHVHSFHFFGVQEQEIFTAFEELVAEGRPPLLSVLATKLSLPLVRLAVEHVLQVASSVYAGYYAQEVIAGALRRQIVRALTQLAQSLTLDDNAETWQQVETWRAELLAILKAPPFTIDAGEPTVWIPETIQQQRASRSLEEAAAERRTRAGVIEI